MKSNVVASKKDAKEMLELIDFSHEIVVKVFNNDTGKWEKLGVEDILIERGKITILAN